ncbi:MAG: methyl-accepting chemotaxis protein [Desulfobacteraceae bacterium]|nr:methyl-accepting chemotaxis protein [Desulfobacteraceae bacterium]
MLNLKNAPLWLKSTLGSMAILSLFGLSVWFSILSLNGIVEKVALYNSAGRLAEGIYLAQGHQDAFFLEPSDSHAEEFRKTITGIKTLISQLAPQVKSTALRDNLQAIDAGITDYNRAFDQIAQNTTELLKLKSLMGSAYETIAKLLEEKVKAPLEKKKNAALTTGKELSPYDQELLSLTERLITLMMKSRLHEGSFYARGDTRDAQEVYAAMQTAAKTFEEWSFIVGTLDDPQVKSYPAVLQPAIKAYSRPNFEQTAHLWSANRQITTDMLGQKEKNLESLGRFKEQTARLVEERKHSALSSMVLFLVLGSLVGIGISILNGYQTSRPIQKIVAMFKDIAEGQGNLTKRLIVDRGDELGEQAKWFNVFVEKIRQMVREVAGITETLNQSSGNLSALSSRMSHGAEEMKNRSNTAAAATEEMSVALRSVACTMEQASSNVGLIVQSAEEMTATIQEIAINAEKGRQIASETVSQTEKASEEIHVLGRAADEIGKVTQSITDISEQTNLLALNATIEAARAGEAGKGFAVVATEIKQLAQQTATATHEIKARVQSIQEATQSSVQRIAHISKVIYDVNDVISTISAAIEEQTAGTRQIADNVTQASQGLNEINQHITQGAGTAESLSQDISQVDQEVGRISSEGVEVDHSAQELLCLAQQLKTLVGRFVVN